MTELSKEIKEEPYFKIGEAVHIIASLLEDNKTSYLRKTALRWLKENYPDYLEKYPNLKSSLE